MRAADPDDTIDAGSRAADRVEPARSAQPITADYPELVQVERRHYVITGEIAKGGMGRVLEARDLRLGRNVAIKELLPRNRDAARRFEREARITARLQHPGIIHVYEAGVWPGGEPFYAMPVVAGRSLDKVVAERTTLERRLALLPVVIDVADALAYAHNENVLHRDLKPANVLVGEFGQTVVIDWGLAKELGATTDPRESTAMRIRESAELEQTVSGSVVGTPAYMPPEQARGDNVDQRADVYAIGALLYKVLTGAAPYAGETAAEILAQVKAGPPRRLADLEPGAPRELVAIAEKAMAREPERRYANADELAQDLKRFETGQLVAAHRYTTRQLILRWLRRHRIAVTAAVLLVAGGAYSLARIVHERRVVEAAAAESELENGRTEKVVLHHAGAALAHFISAMRHGASGHALGFMIADALRAFDEATRPLPTGHGSVIVAVTADGSRIATAAADVVKLWTRDGALVAGYASHGLVRALAFDPTGALLVAGGDDGIARVWRVAGGPTTELAGKSRINDAAWSPDGRWLATAHSDGKVRVWDVATMTSYAEVACHSADVVSVRFSHDGTRLATASQDSNACVWDSTTDALVPLRGHTRPVRSARWSHDDSLVITASDDGTARVWSVVGGKLVVQPMEHDLGSVTVAELSSDDALALTAGDDHVARLWRLPDAIPSPPPQDFVPHAAQVATRLVGHTDQIATAMFGENDDVIATGALDHSVKLWDAASGQEIAWFEHADVVGSLAFVPGPEPRLVSGGRDGKARIWRLPPNSGRRDLRSPVYSIAASRDWVAAGTGDGRVTVWNEQTKHVLTDHRGRVYAVAFSPDGTRLVTGGEDPYLYVWAPGQEHPIDKLGEVAETREITIAHDSDTVAATDRGRVRWWSLHDPRATGTFRADGYEIEVIAFDRDGTWLAGGSSDGSLVVWDVHSREMTDRHKLDAPITALAFSPDGRALVVAGQGQLQLFRFGAGRVAVDDPELQVEGPTGEVRAVAFARDGERVITASDDGVARVWDTRRGKLLGTRGAHAKPLSSLSLIDDSTLWLGSLDGTATRWDVAVDSRPVSELEQFVAAHAPWAFKNEGD